MIPDVNVDAPISDLFANFWMNWGTLFPVVAILLGVFFATFLIRKLKDNFYF